MLMRILGLIVMFADDGTPTVVEADDENVGDKTEKEHKVRKPDAKDEVAPPEEVEDFTDLNAFGDKDASRTLSESETSEEVCEDCDQEECACEEIIEEEVGDE
jgi:hypothetical protein